jgi:hypothetical protein
METDYIKDTLANAKLDQVSFVLALRDVVGGINVLRSLLDVSKERWSRFTNAENGDHLIKGVAVSTVKSDAIQTYVSYIIKTYMQSRGVRITAWTKNTIASDNFTNKAIVGITSGHTFETHEELFKVIATRLIGFDDALVDMAVSTDNGEIAKLLAIYLASRFDLIDTLEGVEDKLAKQIGFFHALLDTQGFTPEFFNHKIQQAQNHFDTPADDDHFHIFDQMRLLTYYP